MNLPIFNPARSGFIGKSRRGRSKLQSGLAALVDQAFYFALALCFAQRLCCASEILLRASALRVRLFLDLTLAGAFAFFTLRCGLVVALPRVASRARARCSLAISASISERIFSIAMRQA